jgi:hypothetical protein
MKRISSILILLGVIASIGLVWAQSKSSAFKTKWATLTKDPSKVMKITASVGEEIPEATLNLSFGPGTLTSVSRGEKSAKKDMLEETDIIGVVNHNLRAVKYCYCKALKKDPEFEGDAIVGLKIKTTGKVSNVSIAPDDIAEHHFGKCLAPRVSKWTFPKFTGKKEDGLKLKSIGYEFPLSFNRAE